MCGLAGFFSSASMNEGEIRGALDPMIEAIHHRGPDQGATWGTTVESGSIGLGFRRLAILDLSAEGHQPKASAHSRFTLVFNGEIYNYAETRRELEGRGHSFRGTSDTEVILASFEEWGIEQSLPRFNGMFAMAVWDHEGRRLVLTRDRLGIKPLYVYQRGGFLSFGSELKSLRAGARFDAEVDPGALDAYLRYLYVPAPATIYRHARQLLPGTFLSVRSPEQAPMDPVDYWSARAVAEAGLDSRLSVDDAVEGLEELLLDAVRLRMVADVPLGALLSGGVDSSAVVALMQEQASRPVKTFTIGFDEAEHDESTHARAVADHLGTDHTDLMLSATDALDVVPLLATMFDEPHADPSQIPTYLVSKLARSEVTVALTGDGGDELFAGYNRYRSGDRMIRTAERVPSFARSAAASALGAVGSDRLGALYRWGSENVPGMPASRLEGQKVQKTLDLMRTRGSAEMYRSLMSAWQEPGRFTGGTHAIQDLGYETMTGDPVGSLIETMMLADQRAYLPGDLLHKVDRASMAVSLEARVPILDHRVVEWSWRMPLDSKLREGATKWALRQVLYRRVPKRLIERPKTGFSVPIGEWLRGPLGEWAGDLLSPDALRRSEVFDEALVAREWSEVSSGRGSPVGMWAIVMFQAWAAEWL